MTGANHILISPVEHPAVHETARQLQEKFGFQLDMIPVDEFGRVIPVELERMVDEKTAIVSIIYGNNEIGTINPVNELAAICHQVGVPFHTDAVQAAAHLDLNMKNNSIDLMSIGAHKFYGPKGVGALFVRKGTRLSPSQTGGKQESGLRAGTQNIPYIVGLAEALRITKRDLARNAENMSRLRNKLINGVLVGVLDSKLTGHPTERLPNHASFVFENVSGNDLLIILDQRGYACSSGSACKVGEPKPSEVLINLGLSPEWASGSLRVTLGRNTEETSIMQFLIILPEIVASLRR
jgi:cysteine desulfurase